MGSKKQGSGEDLSIGKNEEGNDEKFEHLLNSFQEKACELALLRQQAGNCPCSELILVEKKINETYKLLRFRRLTLYKHMKMMLSEGMV